MLPATWTSSAVNSDLQPYDRRLFRFAGRAGDDVLAEYVDSTEEINILENELYLARDVNQDVPSNFHRLLSRPFEMRDPIHETRFRSGYETGVLYSAESVATAALEVGFHRVRFLRESPDLDRNTNNQYVLINFEVATQAIDIRVSPYSDRRHELANPNSYASSQEFGRLARTSGAGAIVYGSARGIGVGPCVAVLKPSALKTGQPISLNSAWSVKADTKKALWINSETSEKFEFEYAL